MQKLRYLPILLIILLLVAFFYFHLSRYFNFQVLEAQHKFLEDWTHAHFWQASLLFMLIYIIAVAISIPGATLLTLTGGFLFGIWAGSLYVLISATVGATLLFLATKTAFGEILSKKAGPKIKQMEAGFQKNALNYLLFLRLVPLFPFWLVNIVPALLNVRLSTFIIATFFGIIPGSVVYVSLGNGLGALFAVGKTPDLKFILRPEILLPILGLALLSLVPVIYRKWKGHSHGETTKS